MTSFSEKEKKFKLEFVPKEVLNQRRSFVIQSYYKDIRFRIVDKKTAYLTIKYDTDEYDTRTEIECEISVDYALNAIRELCKNKVISKTRYYHDGWTIDCYNNELIIAEIEYTDSVNVPTWIDGTETKKYRNKDMYKRGEHCGNIDEIWNQRQERTRN